MSSEIQLSLSVEHEGDYQLHGRDWERCMWLEEVLRRLPLDFVFMENDCVVYLGDDVYCAHGSNPHEWQEFIWVDDDEWLLGESDTGSSLYPRVSEFEFRFVLSELQLKVPMPLSELETIRAWM